VRNNEEEEINLKVFQQFVFYTVFYSTIRRMRYILTLLLRNSFTNVTVSRILFIFLLNSSPIAFLLDTESVPTNTSFLLKKREFRETKKRVFSHFYSQGFGQTRNRFDIIYISLYYYIYCLLFTLF